MSYTSTALEKTEELRKVHCFMLKHSTSSKALSTSYSNIWHELRGVEAYTA